MCGGGGGLQIGHSLRSDGQKLHLGEFPHTQQEHYTDTHKIHPRGDWGMTNLQEGCAVPHGSWGLKFNSTVKLERQRCITQQFQIPRSLQGGNVSHSISVWLFSPSPLFFVFSPPSSSVTHKHTFNRVKNYQPP